MARRFRSRSSRDRAEARWCDSPSGGIGSSSRVPRGAIQDAVLVPFWLTQLQPDTHCPLVLSRSMLQQIAADIDLPSVPARLQSIAPRSSLTPLSEDEDLMARAWNTLVPTDHPLKRALAAAGIDYMSTGYVILSLCLPERCVFRGRSPATARLVRMYLRARGLPPSAMVIDVAHGLYLGGVVTSDALTGSRGLLNHICQHHGPTEGLGFLSRVQRLTTSVSLYWYAPSVGLDDCLLARRIRDDAHTVLASAVEGYFAAATGNNDWARDPSSILADIPYRLPSGRPAGRSSARPG